MFQLSFSQKIFAILFLVWGVAAIIPNQKVEFENWEAPTEGVHENRLNKELERYGSSL